MNIHSRENLRNAFLVQHLCKSYPLSLTSITHQANEAALSQWQGRIVSDRWEAQGRTEADGDMIQQGVTQPFTEFQFNEAWMFATVYTRARHSHWHISFISISVLSCHLSLGLPTYLFLTGLCNKTLTHFPSPPGMLHASVYVHYKAQPVNAVQENSRCY
jgi:hypothetical protein